MSVFKIGIEDEEFRTRPKRLEQAWNEPETRLKSLERGWVAWNEPGMRLKRPRTRFRSLERGWEALVRGSKVMNEAEKPWYEDRKV